MRANGNNLVFQDYISCIEPERGAGADHFGFKRIMLLFSS
jgi:hypothetical protein